MQDIISLAKVITRDGAHSTQPWVDRDSLFSHEFSSSYLSRASTFFFDINMIEEENGAERTPYLMDLRLKLEQPFLCQQAAGEPNMSLL
jgi:hypothetical protein